MQRLTYVFVYLDDILVASPSSQQHLDDLRAVFARLKQHGLVINPAKCQFGVAEIDFLGHRMNSAGIAPLLNKIEAITSFPRPQTQKQLQRFTGMINFYHRFLPNTGQFMD